MPDGFHREVDVEIRPADRILVRHRHVAHVVERDVSEPGELPYGARRRSCPIRSQKPSSEMSSTSTSEVLGPCPADLVLMDLYEMFDGLQLLAVQTEILRQPDIRLKPEFRLTASACDVDVHAWFLA